MPFLHLSKCSDWWPSNYLHYLVELLTVTDPADLCLQYTRAYLHPLYCVESEMVLEKLVLSVFWAVAVECRRRTIITSISHT